MSEAPTPVTERRDHKTVDAAPFVRAHSLPRHRTRRPLHNFAPGTLTPQNMPLDIEAALHQH